MQPAEQNAFAQNIASLRLPRYAEIPHIELYMDQLVGYLQGALRPLYQPDDKIITPSMVNNYVKLGVIAPPRAKKYTREQVAQLIVIGILKHTFSIGEITHLIEQQITSFETDVAYDYFCTALENACRALFSPESAAPATLTSGTEPGDFERDLVIASSAAVAYTLYLRASIAATSGAARASGAEADTGRAGRAGADGSRKRDKRGK
ncbi:MULTISPECIES: DUF1836 domain-containing protein [unclassified Adlercreutzia]|uniref:DUF1836 domain-containing protein n=1 Tax=unclassified Adlercreutzia TaxID=2636013 RepID=UPI001F14DE35|nr:MULTISPECIES: DUF1836 domain-containing protein [unclassified Adlercreutzia]